MEKETKQIVLTDDFPYFLIDKDSNSAINESSSNSAELKFKIKLLDLSTFYNLIQNKKILNFTFFSNSYILNALKYNLSVALGKEFNQRKIKIEEHGNQIDSDSFNKAIIVKLYSDENDNLSLIGEIFYLEILK